MGNNQGYENMKTTSNTYAYSKVHALHNAPRCGARTKINNGKPCQCPAIKGKSRCRLHGGKSSGAPKGNKFALTHGFTTTEKKKFKRKIRKALKEGHDLMTKA